MANPLCVMCLAQGIVSAATELDHILALSNGGADTAANRQGLCAACHRAKTLIDMTGGVR
jgi:5-methylcytosine-specific restriction enzyme A